jgi:hypothetical protein
MWLRVVTTPSTAGAFWALLILISAPSAIADASVGNRSLKVDPARMFVSLF